jgi:hypothetical protein
MSEPVTLDRLEQALAVAAYAVVKYGAQFAPLFERMEREIEEARRRFDGPAERAARLLEVYAREHDTKPSKRQNSEIQILTRRDGSCRLVVDTITSSDVARKVWKLLESSESRPA